MAIRTAAVRARINAAVALLGGVSTGTTLSPASACRALVLFACPFRLRAIARLGDDAAGGGSEDDDSADEYKPDGEDDIRPDDHKIKLDAEDLRETKRAKAAAGMPARSGTAALKSGNAWSGFGSSGGGGGRAGAGGSGGAFSSASPSDGVVGGMRMSVTKKEALRSKGVFKIAPQSKVSVQAGKKEKKPLTAKQKLLLKMRR